MCIKIAILICNQVIMITHFLVKQHISGTKAILFSWAILFRVSLEAPFYSGHSSAVSSKFQLAVNEICLFLCMLHIRILIYVQYLFHGLTISTYADKFSLGYIILTKQIFGWCSFFRVNPLLRFLVPSLLLTIWTNLPSPRLVLVG